VCAGYYEDLSWDNYKSTAARVSGPPPEPTKKIIPPKADFYSHQTPPLLPPKESRDLPTLIQAVREIEAEKQAERRRLKDQKLALKANRRTQADLQQEEEVREAVKEEVERELKQEAEENK
jgi:hypothetical protein